MTKGANIHTIKGLTEYRLSPKTPMLPCLRSHRKYWFLSKHTHLDSGIVYILYNMLDFSAARYFFTASGALQPGVLYPGRPFLRDKILFHSILRAVMRRFVPLPAISPRQDTFSLFPECSNPAFCTPAGHFSAIRYFFTLSRALQPGVLYPGRLFLRDKILFHFGQGVTGYCPYNGVNSIEYKKSQSSAFQLK